MKYTSTQSHRDEILEALHQCRTSTLELFTDSDRLTFCQQAHPDFSPVGWHLGHIAFTEAHWILERSAGQPNAFPHYQKLFAADGLPKAERQHLPSLPETQGYLDAVRQETLKQIDASIEEERLWRWLIQHESQHSETITFILQLLRWRQSGYASLIPTSPSVSPTPEMVQIPAGEVEVGSNAIDALDNERPSYRVYLDSYWIDRYPVTCLQYREFINAGGYQNRHWWSQAGWQWLQEHPVSHPLYWCNSPDWDTHPVCGVSWYEAEAYARYVGKRLPTEAEWERAAVGAIPNRYPWGNQPLNAKRCNFNTLVGHTTPVSAYPDGQSLYGCFDLLGNVWEWTASWFAQYSGFKSYPYRGYSQIYFDNQHRVLRGGSWATRPWALRVSFRNWYHPGVRQILAGFRCASSEVAD